MVHCSDLCYSTLEHTSQAAIRLSAACLSAFTMASTKNSPARYEERTSGPAATYLRSKRRFPLRMLSRKSALLARWAASAAVEAQMPAQLRTSACLSGSIGHSAVMNTHLTLTDKLGRSERKSKHTGSQ